MENNLTNQKCTLLVNLVVLFWGKKKLASMGSFNSAMNRKGNNKAKTNFTQSSTIKWVREKGANMMRPQHRTVFFRPTNQSTDLFQTNLCFGPMDQLTEWPTDRPTDRVDQPTDGPTNQPMDQCTGKHYLSKRCKDASNNDVWRLLSILANCWPTDGPTDGRTDTASYRDARTHLIMMFGDYCRF